MAAAIGTWTFSEKAVDLCLLSLSRGLPALDAITEGISAVEVDHSSGIYVVGCGGFPNQDGILQCDAAIMDGRDNQYGAVLAIQGVESPIRVARRVLERSPPSMLVGEGAGKFAALQGFTIKDNAELLGQEAVKKWQEWKSSNVKMNVTGRHDTLGVVLRNNDGSLTAGVSTSGAPYKLPGRVGDSALPGGGIYTDDHLGAGAVCTGDGDLLLRFSPALRTVNLIHQGASPDEACHMTSRDISNRLNVHPLELGIVALNKQGEFGAGGSVESWTDPVSLITYSGFPYCVRRQGDDSSQVLVAPPVRAT